MENWTAISIFAGQPQLLLGNLNKCVAILILASRIFLASRQFDCSYDDDFNILHYDGVMFWQHAQSFETCWIGMILSGPVVSPSQMVCRSFLLLTPVSSELVAAHITPKSAFCLGCIFHPRVLLCLIACHTQERFLCFFSPRDGLCALPA